MDLQWAEDRPSTSHDVAAVLHLPKPEATVHEPRIPSMSVDKEFKGNPGPETETAHLPVRPLRLKIAQWQRSA
ncbi:hypothetical protein J6590_026019 [Homalodisca vitripennis]|nr:hypothetical protein J6590_026019 [Homalodisca vitripennis]